MRKYLSITVILIFGMLLRFYHNLDISLWHDEAFSALLIKYPWSEMIYRIGLDVHPPAYYVFLRIWHYIFGDTLLSLRSFSVFFSVGSIWAVWILVKESFKNEKAALWAAILVAVNPFQMQFATEARMYTMGAFFALLAAHFLVKALNLQKKLEVDEKQNMPHLPSTIHNQTLMAWSFIGFTLSMIVIIYTHYYLFFTAAALGFYGVLYLFFHHGKNWKRYIPLFLSFLVIVLSFVPWLRIFLFQYRQVGAGYWIPKMTIWSIPSTFWDMLLGMGRDLNSTSTLYWMTIIFIFCAYLLYRFIRQTNSFHKWLVLFAVLAPFAGALLFMILARLKGSSSSVYLDRYFLFAGVFFSIAVGVWLKEIKIKWLSMCLFIFYIIINISAFYYYWSSLNVKTKLGMSFAAKYLKANVEPGQKLYVGSSFMFFNLRYYVDQNRILATPLLFSGGKTEVKNLPHFAGTAILTNEDLLPDFGRNVKQRDTVWLVWTNGFGANKPIVPKNWQELNEENYAEVRPYVGTFIYVTRYFVN